jgi:hypothetical protein
MKMNEKENGWARWWRRGGWNQSLDWSVRRASLGGPTAALPVIVWLDVMAAAVWLSSTAQTRTHDAQPRCSRWAGCLRRIALQTSATCRFAMPVPSPVASHHDPSRSFIT